MYTAKDIRNLALLGHGGDGKSALCESMLYVTKAITRLGKRADGTTVSDFDDEEKKRQYSIKTSVIPVEFGGCKLNVLDNPGYFDFAAEIVQSLRVADAGIICLTAKRRTGLWCAWACGLLGLVWLRATAGIRWTDIFRAPSTVFRSDVAQIVSWAIAVFLLLLLIGTVRSFREQVLPWEKRNIGKYAGLWVLYLVGRWAVNRFLFAAWAMKVFSSGNHTQSAAVVYSITNILWEVALLAALALLLVKTAALLRGRKAASARSVCSRSGSPFSGARILSMPPMRLAEPAAATSAVQPPLTAPSPFS